LSDIKLVLTRFAIYGCGMMPNVAGGSIPGLRHRS